MSAARLPGEVPIATEELAPERAAAILEQRSRALGAVAVRSAPSEGAIAFRIGAERFAVPIAALAGILAATPPTPVPGAPASLLGLIVSRGLLYNLFDPAAALGVTPADAGGRHILLLRGGTPRIALIVDKALGSIRLHDAEPTESAGGLTGAAIDAEGDRIARIDVPKLMAALGLAPPDGMGGSE